MESEGLERYYNKDSTDANPLRSLADEFKNDPRNPAAKTAKPADKR